MESTTTLIIKLAEWDGITKCFFGDNMLKLVTQGAVRDNRGNEYPSAVAPLQEEALVSVLLWCS